jgi:hypothetical protein
MSESLLNSWCLGTEEGFGDDLHYTFLLSFPTEILFSRNLFIDLCFEGLRVLVGFLELMAFLISFSGGGHAAVTVAAWHRVAGHTAFILVGLGVTVALHILS